MRPLVAPHLRRSVCIALLLAHPAQASIFQGETLDAVADAIAWVALVVVPITLITVFWLVHILPEKIAEKRRHPQAKAIHVMCLLSLMFGGLLWPLAWLWAYSKPVFYKMAYGTDVAQDGDEPGARHETAAPAQDAGAEVQWLRTEKVVEREGQVVDRTHTARERL